MCGNNTLKPSDINILVVDDEPLILETVGSLFERFQFKVSISHSGNEAWTLVQKNNYNLILTDVRMPDGDGIELTKKVKARYENRTSVLFMSGFSDVLNEEIYHIGAEGKFTKPFDINAVREAIQRCLLAPEAKWAQKPPTGPRLITIEKKGLSISELESKKAVLFGRGGFFLSHAYVPPARGSIILFSIEILSPEPVKFKGAGIVRWIQTMGKNVIPGLGVEITSMGESEAKLYHQLFGNLIPFIPSLVRISGQNK